MPTSQFSVALAVDVDVQTMSIFAKSATIQKVQRPQRKNAKSYKNAIIETIIEIVSYRKDRFKQSKVRVLTFEKYRKYCNRKFCIFKTEVSKQMFRNHWFNNYKSKISNYSICNLSEVQRHRTGKLFKIRFSPLKAKHFFKQTILIFLKQVSKY